MTTLINEAIAQIDEIREDIRAFRKMFTEICSERFEMEDERGRKASGEIFKHPGFEVFDTRLEKDFETINHTHPNTTEHHIVLSGLISVKKDHEMDIISERMASWVPDGERHKLKALEDTHLITIVIPSLPLDANV